MNQSRIESMYPAHIREAAPLKPCTNCKVEWPTSQQQGNYIDDGISINTLDLGHYGGFTDCIPDPSKGEVYSISEYDPKPYMAHLCHDCCVILFNALPGLAEFAEVRGGHGNLTNGWSFGGSDKEPGSSIPPCCPYAWTWDKGEPTDENPYGHITYKATPDLTWERVN